MSTAELDELERLADDATPGPWKEFTANKGSDLSETFVHGPDKRWLARDFEPFNARFVAAAREAVPALIAEVRRLQAGEKRAEYAIERSDYAVAVERERAAKKAEEYPAAPHGIWGPITEIRQGPAIAAAIRSGK